jgi:hypothetical protein
LKELENIVEAMEMEKNEETMGQFGRKTNIVIMNKGKISELDKTRLKEKERKGSFESTWSDFALETSIN